MFVKRRKITHVRRGVGSRGIGHALVVVAAALLASLLLMSDVVLPVRELVHVERLLVGGGLVILGGGTSGDELVHGLPKLALETVGAALLAEELVVLVGGGVVAVALLPVGGRVVVEGGLKEPHLAANLAVGALGVRGELDVSVVVVVGAGMAGPAVSAVVALLSKRHHLEERSMMPQRMMWSPAALRGVKVNLWVREGPRP
jgi:hypothetical protein